MLLDLDRSGDVAASGYDVCVVGAGAAGISLAVDLVRQGLRVLLLEGGRAGYDQRSQALYDGETEGLPFTGLTEGRFRVLGGTTTQWGGQVLEIDDHVFAPRPWAPGGEWPIAKADLEPHYRRALELEGLAGASDDADAIWRELDGAAPPFGPEVVPAFSRWCPETNFWTLHGPELTRSPLCTVVTSANACELLLAEDGRTVRAVRCRTLGGRVVDFEATRFVLAMGAIETCRLLLQQRDGPWNAHDQVGRRLQEHLCCTVATVEVRDLRRAERQFRHSNVGGFRYHTKLKLSPAAQARLGALDVCGVLVGINKGKDDLAYAFETVRLARMRRFQEITPERAAHFIGHAHLLLWHKFPLGERALDAWGPKTTIKLEAHCEQSPLSEGRITLTSEKDELGLRRARVSWRVSDLERRSIRAFVEVAREAFETAGIGAVTPDPGVMDDGDALDARFRESFHHLGGLRMAARPTEGAVAPDLRLHGTTNAYVCSSAAFPSAGFVNPTHTLIALAARLAGQIAGEVAPNAPELEIA